jgi:hypothetical protein
MRMHIFLCSFLKKNDIRAGKCLRKRTLFFEDIMRQNIFVKNERVENMNQITTMNLYSHMDMAAKWGIAKKLENGLSKISSW